MSQGTFSDVAVNLKCAVLFNEHFGMMIRCLQDDKGRQEYVILEVKIGKKECKQRKSK